MAAGSAAFAHICNGIPLTHNAGLSNKAGRSQPMHDVECVVDCKSWLGEGPVWSPAEKALYWTDVPACTIHRWNPATGEQRSWRASEMVTSMSMRAQGGLIVATTSGVNTWDPNADRHERLVVPEADLPDNRSNDGKGDRRGRFWLGTMQNNLNPDGSDKPMTESSGNLWRIDGDGTYHCMESGIGISNTLAWSPDNTVMYFGDTLVGIYAYDFDIDNGTIANRRLFAKTEGPELGFPDGSTIDAEGFLWNARWDGGCLLRWAPDGTIDRKVAFPCGRVTSAAFGGDDLDVLYVTTARNLDAGSDEHPLAGGIFALSPGVRGVPEVPFQG